MSAPLATVAVISIGEMGLGVARLLQAHNYHVISNISGRSPATYKRAESIGLTLLPNDTQLVQQADYILSIVPPRDALATAERVVTALKASAVTEAPSKKEPLFFLDLNAISPRSAREIGDLFVKYSTNAHAGARELRFVDGGIIGGPPKEVADGKGFVRPSIPLSGPYQLPSAPLAELLNTKWVGDAIGTASGLKMCFASLTKGLTALATQSFSTAEYLGVLPELQAHLETYSPKTKELAERGIVGMQHKAYRWVREMQEIGDTFETDGGWPGSKGVFGEISEVYKIVAEETSIKDGAKGKDVKEVVGILEAGLEGRRGKVKSE